MPIGKEVWLQPSVLHACVVQVGVEYIVVDVGVKSRHEHVDSFLPVVNISIRANEVEGRSNCPRLFQISVFRALMA